MWTLFSLPLLLFVKEKRSERKKDTAAIAAAILGPTMVGLYTESSRVGIASVAIFFVLGAALLLMVDAEKVAKKVRSTLS